MNKLFCSICGCGYSERLRLDANGECFWTAAEPGQPCGDMSGGVNSDEPCGGVLRLEQYTLEVHNRQRTSLLMPPVLELPKERP